MFFHQGEEVFYLKERLLKLQPANDKKLYRSIGFIYLFKVLFMMTVAERPNSPLPDFLELSQGVVMSPV